MSEVATGAAAPTVAGAQPPHKRRQSGVAVLLVLACLAIIAPFTATFNYQARVDWQSAVNVRDEVVARQIERGALSLSLLLFEIQRMVFNQKQFRDTLGMTMDITQVAPYLMSVFGTEDGAEGIGSLVGIDTSALSDLSIEGGSFEYRVYAESGKINVNCLGKQAKAGERDNPAGRVVNTLEALMVPQLYDPYFEEEKSDGQFYTREDVVRALADYIDDDKQRFDMIKLRGGSGPENYRYQQLFDPYRERDSQLDSVEELHLVEGIDDDWMAAFGDELTVYGGCKVNLNFASAEQIALVLRHAVTDEDSWKTEGENFLTRTMPLANYVIEVRQFSLFNKLDDFKKLVEAPDQFLNPLAALGGDADEANNLPRIPEGIAVQTQAANKPQGEAAGDDPEDGGGLKDIATVAPENVYTVEVITSVGAVTQRTTAVWDMQYARSQSQGKGAWLHIKRE